MTRRTATMIALPSGPLFVTSPVGRLAFDKNRTGHTVVDPADGNAFLVVFHQLTQLAFAVRAGSRHVLGAGGLDLFVFLHSGHGHAELTDFAHSGKPATAPATPVVLTMGCHFAKVRTARPQDHPWGLDDATGLREVAGVVVRDGVWVLALVELQF